MDGSIKIGKSSVTLGGEEYPLEPWQMSAIASGYRELIEDGWPPADAAMAEFKRTVMLMVRLDSTWRLLDRVTPTGVHPSVDGEDCYVFLKKGGDDPTDIWSITYEKVSSFWGSR